MSAFLQVEPGVWSVIDGLRSYEVRVSNNEVLVNGVAVAVDAIDPREWDPRSRASGAGGSASLKAPIPGKVVRVLVSVGATVAAGQGCIVVEAMKMQNELKAPRDGVVTVVNCREHDTVAAGAVLVTIE